METVTVEALTVVLLSLPLRWQQNCFDLTRILSLVCRREKAEASIAAFMWLPHVLPPPSCES